MPSNPSPLPRVPIGIRGLDDVLGGLPGQRLYLVAGDPGTGKTTLALQFLLEGACRGEAGLYVTFDGHVTKAGPGGAGEGLTYAAPQLEDCWARRRGRSSLTVLSWMGLETVVS